jgi:hypothetical protein
MAQLHKNLKKIIDRFKEDGWTIDIEESKHFKVSLSKNNYKKTFIVSKTPSSRNTVRDTVATFRREIRKAGFNTLDNFHAYLITEIEFNDVLDAVAERINTIAEHNGTYEESLGNSAILESLINCSLDDYFTDDKAAISEWEKFRKTIKH